MRASFSKQNFYIHRFEAVLIKPKPHLLDMLWICSGFAVDLLPTPMTVTGVGFSPPFVCVSVCFSAWYLKKTDAAKITDLGTEMFHDESWKPFILRSKDQRSRSRVTMLAWVFALLWVLVASSCTINPQQIIRLCCKPSVYKVIQNEQYRNREMLSVLFRL